MQALGLDIGTTTFSAVVVDAANGDVLSACTINSDADIRAECWARLVDPEMIWRAAERVISEMLTAHPGIRSIGLTGQMHGILYADRRGRAVSPLYTWQDGRGDLFMTEGQTYAQALAEMTGKPLATGYGAVTHFYNRENRLVPESAVCAMTIADYIGLRLTGGASPVTHASNAQSFGAPDWPGLSELVHTTNDTRLLGETQKGIPVAVAIGDNQASFIGSVRDADDSVLINIGTGGQVSAVADRTICLEGVETRFFVDGKSLLVGISLCGGRAYALLENLFREVAQIAGAQRDELYDIMNALAQSEEGDPLHVDTRFCGTRADPSLRGAITGIGEKNFTAAHLSRGVLRGMAEELYAPYQSMRGHMRRPPARLIGSGNGIRQNPALRSLFKEIFALPMSIPAHREEAAYGAALFALTASGYKKSVADAQSIIRYQDE